MDNDRNGKEAEAPTTISESEIAEGMTTGVRQGVIWLYWDSLGVCVAVWLIFVS